MKNVYDIKKEKNLNFVFPMQECDSCSKKRDWIGKTLVVMHLHYADTLQEHISYIGHIPEGIDVIVTTSDEEIENRILRETICRKSNMRIVRKQNRGRDISSFLVACREEILKYEYFCFVHDKKEKSQVSKNDTELLVTELWDNLLGSREYICNVLGFMEQNRKIGVLVPPLSMGDYQANAFLNTWFKNFENVEKLLSDLAVKADVDREKPPITLGTVFWARTDALRKLLEHEWKYEDFDEEPLANDGTLSHAVERSFAYIAQDAGYDTGWLKTDCCAGVRDEDMTRLLGKCFELLYCELGIRSPFQVVNYETMKKEMVSFAERFSTLYIYGAGVYGKGCLTMMRRLGLEPEGFVVSNGTVVAEGMKVDGLPVNEIHAIKWTENCGIVVAVGVTNVNAVLAAIRESLPGFKNYMLFSQ